LKGDFSGKGKKKREEEGEKKRKKEKERQPYSWRHFSRLSFRAGRAASLFR